MMPIILLQQQGTFNHTLHREDKSQVVQQEPIELVERREVLKVVQSSTRSGSIGNASLLFLVNVFGLLGWQGDGVKVVLNGGLLLRVKSCSEVHPPNKSTFIDDLIIISKIRAGNLLQDDWPMILILRKYSKALSEQCRNALQIYTFPLAHQLPQVELNNLLI
ncbi:hypothetical protein HUJ05_003884 [Dendroctonus ponderosae]|nr:hypothetical protein HUJ05_003884 [Dendroctonus ponderosae]